MGSCITKVTKTIAFVTKVSEGSDLTSAEVREILKETFQVSNDKIKMPDGDYFAIPLKDLKKFLLLDLSNFMRYKKEVFDCDDFALLTAGHQHLWFSLSGIGKASTFGIVWGDIRSEENPDEPRYHALNFMIADDKQVWLIEPQNDKIYKPVEGSTYYFLYC